MEDKKAKKKKVKKAVASVKKEKSVPVVRGPSEDFGETEDDFEEKGEYDDQIEW